MPKIAKGQIPSNKLNSYYNNLQNYSMIGQQNSIEQNENCKNDFYDLPCYNMINPNSQYVNQNAINENSSDFSQSNWRNSWASSMVRSTLPNQQTKKASDMIQLRVFHQASIPEGRVVGVYFDKQRRIWRANWREHGQGKRKTKNFSVDDYGFEEARRMAIQYRLSKLMEANDKAMSQKQPSASADGQSSSHEMFDKFYSSQLSNSSPDKPGTTRSKRRRKYGINEPIPSSENFMWPQYPQYNLSYGVTPTQVPSGTFSFYNQDVPSNFSNQQQFMMWIYDTNNLSYSPPIYNYKGMQEQQNWKNLLTLNQSLPINTSTAAPYMPLEKQSKTNANIDLSNDYTKPIKSINQNNKLDLLNNANEETGKNIEVHNQLENAKGIYIAMKNKESNRQVLEKSRVENKQSHQNYDFDSLFRDKENLQIIEAEIP